MSGDDEDRPTVILDLNALKKEKLKQEEELASIVQELEFAVGPEDSDEMDSEEFAENFFDQQLNRPPLEIIFFDYESDVFEKAMPLFPKGHEYRIAKTLADLNKLLSLEEFQIVVFNYDVNPRAVNQLTAQIKSKFPITKTLIAAKSISPKKAKIHAKTPSGADGYFEFPLEGSRLDAEFLRIEQLHYSQTNESNSKK